ncbi:hypothetical protein BDB00DRAFT_925573 [Zychaea mexicana]|uniref:uncharacterized protein n=1 Tax=Zychaea mexicana TaxID=64656 RepID=UPI0022FE0F62|nr:uncharacterized protein BDB00DRAFT_925573 [Zychaea mexicana]KAI9497889.1 hypothetical protein BDB00DRAFT_925573 [Zychaea mexicana]
MSRSQMHSTPLDYMLCLSMEVQRVVLSFLTLKERIQCSVVSKKWRSVVLADPNMWHTLSNGSCNYKLHRVLTTYQALIPTSSTIRVVDLSLDPNCTYNGMLAATEDLKNTMDLLTVWDCRCIKEGRLQSDFKQELVMQWFEKFQAVTCSSLNRLTLLWDAFPEDTIYPIPAFVINQFPNLSHFSLKMRNGGDWLIRPSISLSHQMRRLLFGELEAAGANDSSILKQHQHMNLSSICLDVSNQDIALPFPEYILQVLPNLQSINFRSCGWGGALARKFYRYLISYCTAIQTLRYSCTFENDEGYTLFSESIEHTHTKHFATAELSNLLSATNSTLKCFQLCGAGTKDTMHYLLCVIPAYHNTLEVIDLTHLRQEHLEVLSTAGFPRLQRFIGSFYQREQQQQPPVSVSINFTTQLIAFFARAPRLHYIQLENLRINHKLLEFLCSDRLTLLQVLVFESCYGVMHDAIAELNKHSHIDFHYIP